MFNADDEYTPASVSRLREVVRQGRPIIVWVGAGASRWAGLPSWRESARQMRRIFAKSVSGFPGELATKYMESESYPKLFELCRAKEEKLFNKTLVEQFSSPNLGPVYKQLITGLKGIAPQQIVTTNVDLCMEQLLGRIDVIERSDIERCADCIVKGNPFVAKLHGSVSMIESVVFASSQYRQIVESRSYVAAVRSVFALGTVIFVGYGLQDDYVLRLLTENDAEHKLFGAGPHFLITSKPGPPKNGVHRISYQLKQHEDHRAALTVFSVIAQEKIPTVFNSPIALGNRRSKKRESGFYISDFKPSGTYPSEQTFEANNPQQIKISALYGLGFAQGELPSSDTVAFHDLAVGLTCFDRVFLPLSSVGVFHKKATFEVFWALINSSAIRFVDIIHEPVYLSSPESLTGDVGVVRIQDPGRQGTRPSMTIVRRMLSPVPGKEVEAIALMERLESKIVSFGDSELLNLGGMVRSGLLLPKVSRLLGFSDYSLPNAIPRWLAYPTLRFAHLVQTGLICNQLGIRAARVPFGGESLISAAFGIQPGDLTVYDYASYVMAGAFASNLSGYLEANPGTFLKILSFRESTEGEALRSEIADRLETNDGTEFSTAIEGSLKKTVPAIVLEKARNKFSALIKAQNHAVSADVVWANRGAADASLWRWRARSRELLLSAARLRKIRSGSPCLCGSGDRFRDCCMRPLLDD